MVESVGGQAVIEGVMMRKGNKIATAIRLPNKKIKLKKDKIKKRSRAWKKPFFRGIVSLWDMLFIGMKYLIWSADQQLDEHEKITKKEIILTIVFSFGFAIAIFLVLPYILAEFVGVKEVSNPILFNFIDGIIKIIMFVMYIYFISLMKDVRILFQYHGAEHKTVNCYEDGKKLIYKNIKKYPTLHPRCGTSFIVLVFIVSVLVFSVLPSVVLSIWPDFSLLNHWLQKAVLFPLRILSLPIIAAIGYEFLKLTDKFKENKIFKMFIIPGLLLQRITTKEPSEKQIETAVKALKSVV